MIPNIPILSREPMGPDRPIMKQGISIISNDRRLMGDLIRWLSDQPNRGFDTCITLLDERQIN